MEKPVGCRAVMKICDELGIEASGSEYYRAFNLLASKMGEKVPEEMILAQVEKDRADKKRRESVLEELYQQKPIIKKYLYSEKPYRNGANSVNAFDMLQCLYIAGDLSREELELLINSGALTLSQENKTRLLRLDFLLEQREDLEKIVDETEKAALACLDDRDVKRAFHIPIDMGNDHTVYFHLASQVLEGQLPANVLKYYCASGLIPKSLVDPFMAKIISGYGGDVHNISINGKPFGEILDGEVSGPSRGR